jgi:transposase InsO family protein
MAEFYGTVTQLHRLRRMVGPELSRPAKQHLAWLDYYRTHGRNAALTCRHFGISRQTFYRWKRRFDPQALPTLEPRSHRPHHVRQPTWSRQLAEAVRVLREQYPRWGKDKLVVLLRRQDWAVSTSMVGRILTHLKRTRQLREPPYHRLAVRRRPLRRPYATRKPKDYLVQVPGDLVQVDTLDVRPLPGLVFKHFTARDVISRWDVVEVHRRATAAIARDFLDTLQARMPFALKALQVDGGSEFAADFETACRDRHLRLFVLPPRSPKLNGSVERAQRTHTEEFYEVSDAELTVPALNQALQGWERTYNTIRPHQALGYQTPQEFVTQWQQQRHPKCH